MTGPTLGQRIYAVRLALGDGVRKPLSMRDFATRLSQRARRDPPFSVSFVSRWENDQSEPRLEELALIASVDPLRRGPAWLAWGDAERSTAAERHAGRLADPQDEPEAYGRVIPHEMFTPAQPPEEEAPAAPRRAGSRKRRA